MEKGLEWTVISSAVRLREISGAAIPSGTQILANTVMVYAKDKSGVSNLYWKDDAGNEHDLLAITGSGAAGDVAFWSSATNLTGNASFFINSSTLDLGLGTGSPNHSGFTRALTVESGTNTALELSSSRGDAADALIGSVTAWFATNTVNQQRIADLQFVTDGGTANQRGGRIALFAKPNAVAATPSEMARFCWGANGYPNFLVGRTAPNSGVVLVEFSPTSASATGAGVQMNAYGAGTAITGFNIRGVISRGTISAPTATSTDDIFIQLVGLGYDGTTFQGRQVAIQLLAGSLWSGTNRETYIKFETTANTSTVSTERFRIGSAGQWGIGGATYGSNRQLMYSGGSSVAPAWRDDFGETQSLMLMGG